uniref:Uncharacterized protein n=1 Tax=Amphimedon queenslandica TaxID=400682 RepID=A0A1X7SVC0_AMPQE
MADEERAECPVCLGHFRVTSSGLIRLHGPRSSRCSGSNKAVSLPATQSPVQKGRTRASSPPLPVRASTTSSGLILPSSLRVSVICRLPKASRRLAAEKLCSLLEEVVAINSSATWKNLLSFAPRFLFSPGRGGKRWSLASQINRQLESHVEPSIDPHNPRSRSLRCSPRSLDRLRGAIAMKMEEGDLRGAIRLASLDATIWQNTRRIPFWINTPLVHLITLRPPPQVSPAL